MIDQLARQLLQDIQQKFSEAESSPSASQLKAIIESGLKRLNLVTREEFDAQSAVLLRTREKLEALEVKLAELEQQHKAS
ncbi:hypothetical protein TDB9533_02546 [Thalassocella blandensis]|nr:hypothetical protein TDB9533_02546 [Thalassocella blandensis]